MVAWWLTGAVRWWVTEAVRWRLDPVKGREEPCRIRSDPVRIQQHACGVGMRTDQLTQLCARLRGGQQKQPQQQRVWSAWR